MWHMFIALNTRRAAMFWASLIGLERFKKVTKQEVTVVKDMYIQATSEITLR